MMSNIIAVDKELLKTFIFDYIFNHTLEESNGNIKISIYNGFIYYENTSKNLNSIKIIYHVSYHNTIETTDKLENYNYFTDRVEVVLGDKEEYTREECKNIAEKMYLKDDNTISSIIRLLNPNTKFTK